ncbi:MAG: MarR family winged helix-turn-helix transcriptional regulator [Pararhodobacter sp.]|nr:MarR family winged helix-turn-helix transcriptional regulator [Pararhodobacter sp.]
MTRPVPPETPTNPPGSTHVADQIVHIARLVHGGASDPSLTPAQWTALRYFASANRFSRTPSAFSQFHATTRGTASQTVKSLIALGLLERHANQADGRSALIEVTPAGRRKLDSDPLADLTRCIDMLPGTLRATFIESVSRIAEALAQMRATPTFGNCGDCGHCDTSGGSKAYCRCTQSILSHMDMDALCIDFTPTASPSR